MELQRPKVTTTPLVHLEGEVKQPLVISQQAWTSLTHYRSHNSPSRTTKDKATTTSPTSSDSSRLVYFKQFI